MSHRPITFISCQRSLFPPRTLSTSPDKCASARRSHSAATRWAIWAPCSPRARHGSGSRSPAHSSTYLDRPIITMAAVANEGRHVWEDLMDTAIAFHAHARSPSSRFRVESQMGICVASTCSDARDRTTRSRLVTYITSEMATLHWHCFSPYLTVRPNPLSAPPAAVTVQLQ